MLSTHGFQPNLAAIEITRPYEDVFNALYLLDLGEYIETKGGMEYLPWARAWAEVKRRYPGANYQLRWFDGEKPYVGDEDIGYLVSTSVTISGLTYDMWLPVLDERNNALKRSSYTYEVPDKRTGGKRTVTVDAINIYDVNKAIMRCLVKNLAMHGVGLSLYYGESVAPEHTDAPEDNTRVVVSIAEALVKKGFDREKVYDIIGKHNRGERSVKSIASLEVGDAIIEDLKEKLADLSDEKMEKKE